MTKITKMKPVTSSSKIAILHAIHVRSEPRNIAVAITS